MKSKQTKKRLGVVAVMLLLVIAIGATAGTTLAKYIYSATVESGVATVAKWGFTVSANTTELFSDAYNANKIASATDSTLDVKAEDKVVAPGTSNDSASGKMTITMDGSAEVDAALTIKVSNFQTVWLDETVASKVSGSSTVALGEGKYYPLQWKINETAVDFSKVGTEDEPQTYVAAFATALKTALEAKLGEVVVSLNDDGDTITADLPNGTSLAGVTLTISWEWKFENEKDVQDTILGALAADNTPTMLYTSADDGETITNIDMSKYTTASTDGINGQYNLKAQLGLSAMLVQTTNAD